MAQYNNENWTLFNKKGGKTMTAKELAEWHLSQLRKHSPGKMANFHLEAIELLERINQLAIHLNRDAKELFDISKGISNGVYSLRK